MKILKEKSREYNGKPYYKYKINLTEESLEDSGFKEGDELESESEKGKLILRKKKFN
jgi:hypothetical protein